MGRFGWTSRGLLVAAVAFYLLQLVPVIGAIVMFFGGPFITGLLLDGAIIALLVEALTGQVAFAWAVVPVMAFGAYYSTYIGQTIDLYHQNAALQTTNSGQVFTFDPSRYSLVSDDLPVSVYAAPVIFAHRDDVPEGYLAHLLLPRGQCKFDRDPTGHMDIMGVSFDGRLKTNLCELIVPEKPPNTIVETVKSGDPFIRYEAPSGRQVVQITANGKVLGSSTILMSQRLTLFPLFLAGCAAMDNSSAPLCYWQFMTRPVFVNGHGLNNGNALRESEASMLGLHAYSEDELENIHPGSAAAPEITRAAGRAAQTMDDSFASLRALAEGEDIAPTNSMGYAVTTEPDRLVPLATPLADRFIGLAGQIAAERAACPLDYVKPPPLTPEQRHQGLAIDRGADLFTARRLQRHCRLAQPKHVNRADQMYVLAMALSALPDGAFDAVKQRVGDSVMTFAYDDSFDKLYARLGRKPERCTGDNTGPLCDP